MWFKQAQVLMALEFLKCFNTTWTLLNNTLLDWLSMKRKRDFQRSGEKL